MDTPWHAPTVMVYPREQAGHVRYYPCNEEARLFARMARQETLNAQTLALIGKLRYRVEYAERMPRGVDLVKQGEGL